MVLIIDGHNLIPHMPGVDLSDPDDEGKLVQLLQEYCRLRRKTAEVFFDKAPVGMAGVRQYGLVKAHFVHEGTTADTAIMAYLKKLGKRAKNTTVVSSDRQVLAAARGAHAATIRSDEFAAAWAQLAEDEPELDPRDRQLDEEEVADWEQLFRRGHPARGGKDKYNK
ncbi:MAG: NYN domain-containing protein [Brevefilum sp.]|nr:NYN domain-containing protein [Brevefilum sp.]